MFRTIKQLKKLRRLLPSYLNYLMVLMKRNALGESEKNQALLLEASYHILAQLNRHETQLKILAQKTGNLEKENTRIFEKLEDNEIAMDRLLVGRKSDIVEEDAYLEKNPDVSLALALVPFLPNPVVLDIGANLGEVSSRLLDTGCEVYAFEPDPRAHEKLRTRLVANKKFTLKPYAISAKDSEMKLNLVAEKNAPNPYEDVTAYSSLVEHPMPTDIPFADSVKVPSRSITSLIAQKEIPASPSLVKIDTEGFELEVIKGMGEHTFPVVVTEFWGPDFMLSRGKAQNTLEQIVAAMKPRGYKLYIVVFLREGSWESAYYSNWPSSANNAAGNIFFFKDVELYLRALEWCQSHLAEAALPQKQN